MFMKEEASVCTTSSHTLRWLWGCDCSLQRGNECSAGPERPKYNTLVTVWTAKYTRNLDVSDQIQAFFVCGSKSDTDLFQQTLGASQLSQEGHNLDVQFVLILSVMWGWSETWAWRRTDVDRVLPVFQRLRHHQGIHVCPVLPVLVVLQRFRR